MVNPSDFWNNKILNWEAGRYLDVDQKMSWLEMIANRSSASLRFRMLTAKEELSPFINEKSVLEIGCGSGLLAEDIVKLGATSYRGVDLAESAINGAKSRVEKTSASSTISFEVGSVVDMNFDSENIVFSLGLLDWLNDDELEVLFRKQGKSDFVHTISEKRVSLQQYLHRLYVQTAYGFKTKGYRPRYYTVQKIANIANQVHKRDIYVYRSKNLSFGALVSSLPLSGSEVLSSANDD